jgi:hypothetical protein
MTAEQLERLAILIHEEYVAKQTLRNPNREIEYPTWDRLPPSLKQSNIRQAAAIPDKLSKIGCYLGTDGGSEWEVDSFTEDEIEYLAEYEHELWAREREENGWILAPEKNSAKKETPSMVPYAELTEDIKELDRDAIRNIIPLTRKLGLQVFRSARGVGDRDENKTKNKTTVGALIASNRTGRSEPWNCSTHSRC